MTRSYTLGNWNGMDIQATPQQSGSTQNNNSLAHTNRDNRGSLKHKRDAGNSENGSESQSQEDVVWVKRKPMTDAGESEVLARSQTGIAFDGVSVSTKLLSTPTADLREKYPTVASEDLEKHSIDFIPANSEAPAVWKPSALTGASFSVPPNHYPNYTENASNGHGNYIFAKFQEHTNKLQWSGASGSSVYTDKHHSSSKPERDIDSLESQGGVVRVKRRPTTDLAKASTSQNMTVEDVQVSTKSFIPDNDTDASYGSIRFIPVADSPLFALGASGTRKKPSSVSSSKLPQYSKSAAPDLPERTVETISVHSADADGEDLIEDGEVYQMLSFSPLKDLEQTAIAIDHDSLFTPLPSDDDRSLFTPEPLIRWKRSRPRIIASPLPAPYVLVPRPRKPISEYIWMSTLAMPKKRSKKRAVDTHVSVRDALQASFQHNAEIGSFDEDRRKEKAKKRKRRREEETGADAPAGSSSISVVRNKRQRRDSYAKSRKSHVTIDLTLSDDEENNKPPLVVLPTPRRSAGKSQVTIEIIKPIDIQILAFNTRLLRKFRKDWDAVVGIGTPVEHRRCLLDISNASSSSNLEDEFSLGDPVPDWRSAFHQPAEDSDNDILDVESLPREKSLASSPSIRPLPPPQTQPPKIDLASMRTGKSNTSAKLRLLPGYSATSATVTSSHSSPGSVSYNAPQLPFDVSAYPDATLTPIPSAKSLGKRKAASPPSPPFPNTTSPHHLLYPSSSHFSTPSRHGLRTDRNLDMFIHDYGPSPSPVRQSTSLVTYSHLDAHSSAYHDAGRTPSSSTDLYREENPSDQSALFSETFFNKEIETEPAYVDPWSLLSDTHAFETIDPTLLGGDPVVSSAFQDYDSAMGSLPEPLSFHSAHSSSPSSSNTSPIPPSEHSEDGYEPSTTTTSAAGTEPEVTNTVMQLSHSSEEAIHDLLPRRHVKRQIPDMIATDDIFISSGSDYAASKRSLKAGSESSVIVVSRPRGPRLAAVSASSRPTRIQSTPPPAKIGHPRLSRNKEKWPMTSTAAYCHQCRNRSFVVKVACSCTKIYCLRCLVSCYHGESRVFNIKTVGCPACLGYCSCTSCCRKRGVEYVPHIRRGCKTMPRPPPDIEQLFNLKIRDSSQSPPTPLTHPPAAPRIYPPVITSVNSIPSSGVYWGTIYGLDGAKMGTSYVVAAPKGKDAPPLVYSTSVRERRRIYIGAIQRSWGLGRRPKSKEINPLPVPKKLPSHRVPRMYVGNPAFLFYRTDQAAEELAGLSPLTSIDEDWEDEDEDVEKLEDDVADAFSPDSLTDEDVKRAISLGLNACGIQVHD